mmetsp:Transcript_11755/g.29684  ORF Transcript_11755/g.29684 Transcript_11755/m.29684 type:complete len:238 (+) Transcript_11755:37-750(+)
MPPPAPPSSSCRMSCCRRVGSVGSAGTNSVGSVFGQARLVPFEFRRARARIMSGLGQSQARFVGLGSQRGGGGGGPLSSSSSTSVLSSSMSYSAHLVRVGGQSRRHEVITQGTKSKSSKSKSKSKGGGGNMYAVILDDLLREDDELPTVIMKESKRPEVVLCTGKACQKKGDADALLGILSCAAKAPDAPFSLQGTSKCLKECKHAPCMRVGQDLICGTEARAFVAALNQHNRQTRK